MDNIKGFIYSVVGFFQRIPEAIMSTLIALFISYLALA